VLGSFAGSMLHQPFPRHPQKPAGDELQENKAAASTDDTSCGVLAIKPIMSRESAEGEGGGGESGDRAVQTTRLPQLLRVALSDPRKLSRRGARDYLIVGNNRAWCSKHERASISGYETTCAMR
jgi:hypothetical protein